MMRYFTLLGTGTSQGVPIIGCQCAVCQSTDERDKRLRTAAMLTVNGQNIVIDTGPDFRQQMLRAQVDDVLAILFTHEHNDHVAGLDDVRPLNFKHNKSIPLYATPSVEAELKQRFRYAFEEDPYPGAPRLEFVTLSKDQPFELAGQWIQPIEVSHGRDVMVLGFRFDDLTYITDCKTISDEEFEKVRGTRILVLDALHFTPHHSHLNVPEALAIIERVQPEQAYLIHISHNMGLSRDVNRILPPSVELGYDGLKIFF